MSNLPPGVSDSDIPGNRPEDLRYESLWETIYNKAEELEIPLEVFDNTDNGPKLVDLIDWAYAEAYREGYEDGSADVEYEYALKAEMVSDEPE